MGAEQFVLQHLGEAENGVERRAQLMAHGGEEARLGEIGLLGAPARFVGIGLGLLQFADEIVLLDAEEQALARHMVEALGQHHEEHLRRADEGEQREARVLERGDAQTSDDGDARSA